MLRVCEAVDLMNRYFFEWSESADAEEADELAAWEPLASNWLETFVY